MFIYLNTNIVTTDMMDRINVTNFICQIVLDHSVIHVQYSNTYLLCRLIVLQLRYQYNNNDNYNIIIIIVTCVHFGTFCATTSMFS